MTSRIGRLLRFRSKSQRDAPQPDRDLIEAIKQGDEQAWALFLAYYTDRIYTKAWEYSQTAFTERQIEDREDEAMELYTFMAAYLRRSLNAFKGLCQPQTWVSSILNNRPRILKAYLLHKNPERAEIRLPKIMEARSEAEREIFKRLVWGMDPGYIAQDLNLAEDQCWAIETLLKERAKRVYQRILANRTARKPKLLIDALVEDDEGGQRPSLALADPAPNPEQTMQLKEEALVAQGQIEIFEGILDTALEVLSTTERRILIFLYNEECTANEIVERALAEPNLGLAEARDLNRVYYIKDRALGKILALALERLNRLNTGHKTSSKGRQRELLKPLEDFIRERGFPLRPP